MNTQRHWVVTTDGRRASLFACRKAANGTLHLEHVRSIENAHEHEHEQGRPTMLGGSERKGSASRSGAAAAPHSVAVGHTEEEERRRFAREVSAWIGNTPEAVDGRLSIFAPARLLGQLRTELGATVRARSDLLEGELTPLRPEQLAAHPAVLAAVTGQDKTD